jgi:DNA-binding GntR family transcriptional regulator
MTRTGTDDADLPLSEQVYRRIKAEIRDGALRSGQRLKEIELAERLDVSRTPVREAIRRLASEGLIELGAGRGMAITTLDRRQVAELYDLRAALEGTAARLAALNASPSDLAALRRLAEAGAGESDPREMARLNRHFHETIREAARNRYLDLSLAQLSDSLALLPGTTFEAPGRAEGARGEHAAILDAIVARDGEAAEALARRHIAHAGEARFRMMFGV